MELYVCYGTFRSPKPGGHPCRNAYEALVEAGHDPDVKRSYGLGPLPDFLQTPARKKVKQLTGTAWVPILILDDGDVVDGSQEIIDWAKANPAGAKPKATASA
jgi:hypothetical protein